MYELITNLTREVALLRIGMQQGTPNPPHPPHSTSVCSRASRASSHEASKEDLDRVFYSHITAETCREKAGRMTPLASKLVFLNALDVWLVINLLIG